MTDLDTPTGSDLAETEYTYDEPMTDEQGLSLRHLANRAESLARAGADPHSIIAACMDGIDTATGQPGTASAAYQNNIRAGERHRIAELLRTHEQTLTKFARDSQTVNFIATLLDLGHQTPPTSPTPRPPPTEPTQ